MRPRGGGGPAWSAAAFWFEPRCPQVVPWSRLSLCALELGRLGGGQMGCLDLWAAALGDALFPPLSLHCRPGQVAQPALVWRKEEEWKKWGAVEYGLGFLG